MTRLLAIALFLTLTAGPALAEDKGPFDVLAYGVSLSVDTASRSVLGEETIRLRLREPAREVAFSDNALEILRAPAAVRREAGRLVLALPHAGRAGEAFVLRIAYRGQPRRGLHFEPGLVYTSYFACDWMVCDQDRPGDKARFDLRLRLPRDLRAVERPVNARPYSAYLYGFAAGKLNEARLGRGLRAFSASRSPAALHALFAPTPDMVAFFEDKAGVRLPSSDYWQLHTTASEAQEGSDFAIIGDGMISPILETPQEDWVIAHELAHQWWGDLITCESWSEVWLNEGFAVFMTAAWKEHRWGRAAYDREMELARRRLAASAAAGFDKPLTWTGAYPSLSVRRGVVYSKGALFLDALRTRLGEEAFWRAIRIYTRRHAGDTVVSGDFQAAVEAAAPGKSGDLFRTWVFAGA